MTQNRDLTDSNASSAERIDSALQQLVRLLARQAAREMVAASSTSEASSIDATPHKGET